MPIVFPFDPDLAKAATIPSRLYVDPVYHELERERIFSRTWQVVARTEQLTQVGDYVVVDIAGESIVLVRNADGLRGYHNVCLHRAGPVAYGCGRRQTMQCKYHGWTYSLSGELLRAPEMETTENFRPSDFKLHPVQVATWGPLVFANLDLKAPPLEHYIDGIPARAESFRPASMRWVMRKDYHVKCNWKVYVDNYLEGYHLPVVHPGLHKELDYDQYRVEPHRYWSLQHAPLRPVEGHAADRTYVADETGNDAQYYWLFPNLMLNVYLGQLQTNVVLPDGPDACTVIFEWFAHEPPADPATDPVWSRRVNFSDEIQAEDIEICEVVQKNLRSRVYDRGRYSAARENGVHHFHSLLHEFLT
ncbi:MAG: SRPBCC family protein [Gemmatimonadaceae bacterium]|nr:SRPBCC family protein [Gemmatimonadaceae bacterium]